MVTLVKEQTAVDDFIALKRPTAQAKILGLELLKDRKPHSRQEIIQYIRKRSKELNLEEISQGCISGGIQDILAMSECEKLGAGTYRLSGVELKKDIPVLRQASKVCENAIIDIQNLARKIDYITANQNELEDLGKLKKCVTAIENVIQLLNE
ncbi:MAG: hypothetical protein NC397_03405 [Clostridium sp.]|nr:hypothetical protein [Clostridium sp.]